MGFFDKTRKYVVDYSKVRTYVVPEGLADFKVRPNCQSRVQHKLTSIGIQLSPFVTRRMEPTKSTFTRTIESGGKLRTVQRAPNGKDFLKQWAMENPAEVKELEELES